MLKGAKEILFSPKRFLLNLEKKRRMRLCLQTRWDTFQYNLDSTQVEIVQERKKNMKRIITFLFFHFWQISF